MSHGSYFARRADVTAGYLAFAFWSIAISTILFASVSFAAYVFQSL